MFATLFKNENIPKESAHQEGELYKVITTFGKTFELKYGYYGEKDRQNPLCQPAVIYPDFTVEPLYTDNGEPFVTMLQDACTSYGGNGNRTPDTTCAECKHFKRGEEWFGICTHPKNKRANESYI